MALLHYGKGSENRSRLPRLLKSGAMALGAAALSMVICQSSMAVAGSKEKDRGAFGSIVADLMTRAFPAASCGNDKRLTVGLWSIPENKSPVGASATKRVYDEVVGELLRQRPKCVDVLDSAGIGAVITHLQKSGALERSGGNELSALSEAHQNVDVVIFPELTAQSGTTFLTLRVVERASAKALALTAPREVPKKVLGEDTSDAALALDAAIRDAASELVRSAPDLKELQTTGIFFEATAAQPPAALFLKDQIVAALANRGSNALTQKAIKVRGIAIKPANPNAVAAEELEPETLAKKDKIYDLTGRYWIRPGSVDLRLSLVAPDGGTTAWSGRIRLTDLKGLELRPSNKASLVEPLPKAKFTFQATTPKGPAPVHRPGDQLQLMLRAGRDVWVYCFYIDSQQKIFPIFPPPPKFAAARSNAVARNRLVRLPDPKIDTFSFSFTDSTIGEELVSCFAADRDVRSDLPSSFFPQDLKPIEFLTVDQLRKTFGDVNNAQVAESVVTVTLGP